MLIFPNAKINLGLNVLERRGDGYHNLHTIFYPANCCDALEFVEAFDNKTEIEFSGLKVEGLPGNNLVLKAYQLLKTEIKLPDIKIHLHKKIPAGAGLGGGSADAAFMLTALNSFFELKLSQQKLIELASCLGADCAFFINNKPSFASGIGNELTETKNILKGYFIVVVKPNVSVSTVQAYAGVEPRQPKINLLELYHSISLEDWKNHLFNDFEESVFKLFPQINDCKQQLYLNGAVYASMSGSGSAVYGIFRHEVDLKKYFNPKYFIWQGFLE